MPGLVRWMLGIVFWVSGIVSWVSGIVFWVSGFVSWVSGVGFGVSGFVSWVSGLSVGFANQGVAISMYQPDGQGGVRRTLRQYSEVPS